MTAALALGGIGVVLACLLQFVRIALAPREKRNENAVTDAIDALLPQSQCAQCGYPGCRPYAAAVADGARTDLCVPGGPETVAELNALLARGGGDPAGVPAPVASVARIDAKACVGCGRCLDACPVDAIAGAPQFLHAVVADHCTGCGLCLPPCPVDCIALRPATPVRATAVAVDSARPAAHACIGCGWCVGVCPRHLAPDELHRAFAASSGNAADVAPRREDAAASALACIECGACTAVCPSGIDLVAEFRELKRQRRRRNAAAAGAEAARGRSAAREDRLARGAEETRSRRAERMRVPRQW